VSDGITDALRENLDVPPPGRRIIHVHVDLHGLLSSRRRIVGLVDGAGRELPDEEARRRLLTLVASGVRCMPIGEACDGFDPITGCPGHDA
jgi:hypothetical protein